MYYLDATYSMVKPSKLWDPVRADLADAINAIEDENTEIYVIAFGGNGGYGLKEWKGYATLSGKDSIIKGFMAYQPNRHTMTYLDVPLKDFDNKIDNDRVTYCFLMTDGQHQGNNSYYEILRKWTDKYGSSNVYGFYVMLNGNADDAKANSIISQQKHLWKVETSDVNINLVRLDNESVYNVRNDDSIEIPISGQTDNLHFRASFPEESGLRTGDCNIIDGKLSIKVDIAADRASMPDSLYQDLYIFMDKGGKFDFLVTDNVKVKCLNRRERTLKTPKKVNFGKVEHYDAFWFVPDSLTPAKYTIDFEFNNDATEDKSTFAELEFVDRNGSAIGPDQMSFKVNGRTLTEKSFSVTPDEHHTEIEISFPEGADIGKHKGYLKLSKSNLQRVNNDNCTGNVINVCSWSVQNKKRHNPLAFGLMMLTIFLLSAIILWVVILRPIIYPRFGSVQKTFTAPGMAPLIVRFKGARMVVMSAVPVKKQSVWNRFWTGKVIYKTYPPFISPVVMRPFRGGRLLVKADNKYYRVFPNPMPKIGKAAVDIISTNNHITIN